MLVDVHLAPTRTCHCRRTQTSECMEYMSLLRQQGFSMPNGNAGIRFPVPCPDRQGQSYLYVKNKYSTPMRSLPSVYRWFHISALTIASLPHAMRHTAISANPFAFVLGCPVGAHVVERVAHHQMADTVRLLVHHHAVHPLRHIGIAVHPGTHSAHLHRQPFLQRLLQVDKRPTTHPTIPAQVNQHHHRMASLILATTKSIPESTWKA